MTGIGWPLVDVASRLLARDEREAVRGDLVEAGESAWQGLCDVVGLVVRRQVGLWKNWRPWLATFGVAWPCTLLLMGFSLTVSRIYQLYAWIIGNQQFIDPKVLKEVGLPVAPGVAQLVCYLFLLIGWSWIGGFVVGSMSRRTVWVSAAFSFSACLFCLAEFRAASVPRFCLLLFLAPAIWGVRRGLQISRIKLNSAIALAVAVTVLTIATSNSRGLSIPSLELSWPAWYLVATAQRPNWLFRRS
jgi:hypothetical protein